MHAASACTGVYTITIKSKNTKKIIYHPRLLIIAIILLAWGVSGCDNEEETPSKSKKIHEASYQQYWCKLHQGKAEVVLKDRTRCDCLTQEYAVEVDFAKKWAEAIGQSLHYARLTGKKAGVLLIVNGKKDTKHARRLKENIAYYKLPIRVWQIAASDLSR